MDPFKLVLSSVSKKLKKSLFESKEIYFWKKLLGVAKVSDFEFFSQGKNSMPISHDWLSVQERIRFGHRYSIFFPTGKSQKKPLDKSHLGLLSMKL